MPRNTSSLSLLLYEKFGDKEGAKQEYEKAVKIKPEESNPTMDNYFGIKRETKEKK